MSPAGTMKYRGAPSRRTRRGVALLIVLMVTAILTIVVLDFAESTRINFYIATNISDGLRAYYMAKSGAQVAEGALLKDMQKTKSDHLWEDWNDPMFSFIPISDRETISVTITDETGKFNLNGLVTMSGNPNQFQVDVFKKLLELQGLDVALADPVVDWVDKDDQAVQGGGAEDDVYGYSVAQPQSYKSKNGKLLSLAEIRLIRGITDDVYNKLAETCTIYSDNRYNINTINENVLTAVIGVIDEKANAKDIVSKITAFRNTEDSYFEGNKTRQQLTDLGIDPTIASRLSRYLTTGSRYFSVDVTANVGSTVKSVHAVLQRSKKKVKMIYYRPGERLRPLPTLPGATGTTPEIPGLPGGAGGLPGIMGGLGLGGQ